MNFKVLPLVFAAFKVILANQEFHESPGEGRCNMFFRCPLKDEYIDLADAIGEGVRLDERYYKCCSFYGRCGETDEYCGEGCQNGDCLPGAAATTNTLILCSSYKLLGKCDEDCPCPNGQCCSKYGYCGTGEAYCGSTTTTTTKKTTTTTKKTTTTTKKTTTTTKKTTTTTKKTTTTTKKTTTTTKKTTTTTKKTTTTTKKSTTTTKRTSTIKSTVTVTQTITTKKTNSATTTTTKPTTTSTSAATKTSTLQATPPAGSAGVVVYLPYYGLYSKIDLMNYDFTGIDVVNYAFLRINDKGVTYSSDTNLENSWKGVGVIPYLNNVLKKEYPHLRTVISVGGASGSKNFGTILKSNRLMKTAAANVVNFCNKHGFDGVDLDWEFPNNSTESGYYYDFIVELRSLLGDDKLLTLAAAGKPKKYHGYVSKFAEKINWINVMTYDYAGSWNRYAGFNSPLYYTTGDKNDQYDADQSIKAYIEQGVPASKLCLGGAFYGRTWKVSSSTNGGYNQKGDGTIKGQSSDTKTDGKYSSTWSYFALRNETVLVGRTTAGKNWKRTWHEPAMSPTLLNTSDMRYISYDDIQSMRERVKYCKTNGLAGYMIWELSQDYNRELIDEVIKDYHGEEE